MRFYGLTGGIGAGKSTVASMLEKQGIPVLDLDKVGHKLLEEDKTLQKQLVQAFGDDILVAGIIDRKNLGEIAFSSQVNTHKLNHIMHPAILEYEQQWRNHIQENSNTTFAVIEASVLIESGGVERMDGLVVVLAHQAIRQQRASQRIHYNSETFAKIIKQQTNDTTRKQLGNYILENNQDLAHLQQQTHRLCHQLCQV
ncbi:MAG: dephospho-CoA kinase [Ghiorsea sp.]|nr:dephospho-CoA kinase [Ghiorsea sp.]MDQ7005157.1 dephospho-CoA kinase [Ghiorsea sp.]